MESSQQIGVKRRVCLARADADLGSSGASEAGNTLGLTTGSSHKTTTILRKTVPIVCSCLQHSVTSIVFLKFVCYGKARHVSRGFIVASLISRPLLSLQH